MRLQKSQCMVPQFQLSSPNITNILRQESLVPPFQPLAYFRDRLVPAADAKLSIYDLGLVMGATVTDMARTYRHEPFRLKDHLVRFYESCKYARLKVPL